MFPCSRSRSETRHASPQTSSKHPFPKQTNRTVKRKSIDSKGEGMERSFFIAFCAVVPAFASLSSPLPPLGPAISSRQVNLRPNTALKPTIGLKNHVSGEDKKQIPPQLTSTMPPDSRPGVSFHDDSETSFRVWAPHARKVSLQVISLHM